MSGIDEDIQLRAAWLYYMEGYTQADVAARLGLTRLRVNRLLAEARRSGLVSIALNARLASCVALEHELMSAFGLSHAVIVPTPDDPDLIPELLGVAAADFLSGMLERQPVTSIGLGWGATLHKMVRRVKPGRWPNLMVTSMIGGLTKGSEINTFELAAELARRLSAECNYLAAPVYMGSPASRDVIVEQDVFREAFERIASVDMAFLTAGDLSTGSLLIRHGVPRDVTPEVLAAHGAVGDVLGQFVDRWGRPIDHEINRRVVAPPVGILRQLPLSMVVAGGRNKSDVIAAILCGGLISGLVSDEVTARGALERGRALAAQTG